MTRIAPARQARGLGLLLLCAGLSLPPAAQAGVFKDAALQQLHEQGRDEELLRLAQTRAGAEALAAQALAQALPNDAAALARAVQAAERCVHQHADQASCHYAQGVVLGVEALRGGWLRGLGLLSQVLGAFERALALDAAFFEARSNLQQLYLLVPGLAGGGADRARALLQDGLAAEQTALLRARLLIKQKRWPDAERELAGIQLGEARAFHNDVLNAWSTLARQWLKGNDHARARHRFETLASQLPQLALPSYWLGRVAADAGQHEEALRHYGRAQGLSGAAALPLAHRIGLSLEELGRREEAREQLLRFLQDRYAAPSALADARKHLKDLGA